MDVQLLSNQFDVIHCRNPYFFEGDYSYESVLYPFFPYLGIRDFLGGGRKNLSPQYCTQMKQWPNNLCTAFCSELYFSRDSNNEK